MRKLRIYSLPYLFWMGLFILIPTAVLLILAFSNLSLYDLGRFDFSLVNFAIFSRSTTWSALLNSLKYASITAVLCFLIGYPVALYLSTLKEKTRKTLMSLLIVPLWSNMLLRINAWEKLFTPSSIINDVFGISLNLLGTDLGLIIGMVAMYLPFMIFPIFSVLEKMDEKLFEAARDLGANELQVFTKVTFPLSAGGVISGFIMTFLPAMTTFALPARLGLGKIKMIGNLIESKFMLEVLGSSGQSINQGALISLLLMMVSISAFVLITKVDKEGETLI